jgi:predicted dinucleotide-binding enzyme
MSMKGTPDSPKMSAMWPTMVLRNWPSSCSDVIALQVPESVVWKAFGSVRWKA